MALLNTGTGNSGSTAKITKHAEKPPEIYPGRHNGMNIDISLIGLDAYMDFDMLKLYE